MEFPTIFDCAMNGNVEGCLALIEQGIDLNTLHRGHGALHFAVKYGHREVAKILTVLLGKMETIYQQKHLHSNMEAIIHIHSSLVLDIKILNEHVEL